MHVCASVSVNGCVHICVHLCMCTCVCAHTHTYMYTHICPSFVARVREDHEELPSVLLMGAIAYGSNSLWFTLLLMGLKKYKFPLTQQNTMHS